MRAEPVEAVRGQRRSSKPYEDSGGRRSRTRTAEVDEAGRGQRRSSKPYEDSGGRRSRTRTAAAPPTRRPSRTGTRPGPHGKPTLLMANLPWGASESHENMGNRQFTRETDSPH